MSPEPSFPPTLKWLRFRKSIYSDTAQTATLKTGSFVEIIAYNAEEEGEDVIMRAKIDRSLGVSLISRSRAEATGHEFVPCQIPVQGMDTSGQEHLAKSYVELRWFIRGGDPKSYDERFHVVEGLDSDAVLGASALQE